MARRSSFQKGSVSFHNGCWTVRYRERDSAGKWRSRREKLKDCKDKKEALKKASFVMADVNSRNDNPETARMQERGRKARETTFRSFVEVSWQHYAKKEGLRASTMCTYKSIIDKHLLPAFGDRKLAEIEPSDVTRFFAGLTGVGPSRERAIYQLLNLIFDLAVQENVIQTKPTRSKLHRPKDNQDEKPGLPAATLKALVDLMPDEYRLFVLLIATTGLRIGEALCLRWFNFDAEGQTLSVTHTLWRRQIQPPKTKSSKRVIHLPAVIVGLAAAHFAKSDFKEPSDFIFCQSDGSPLNAALILRKYLHPAMDRLGVKRQKYKHGFHLLRHSAATVAYEKTKDLKLVQKMLGHAQISITGDIYVHLEDDALKVATELLVGEILGNGALTVTQDSRMVS